ncbi:helix-turn-helix domain-containing protein [Alkalibacterium sp. AK22]|uniref:helix-turn-helix domain-containing protein n=1 Tax=Alkalibacterium sp. AK22 TaxID=1229520 RepID=UPI0009E00B6F|nr:helix-turn-helix domain-containing protein [Alkalibacterium sp. AK22]
MKIGEKIKSRRKEIKMTQAELADGICTQAMVSRIEKKKVRPSRGLMEKISERLGVSINYFYGEDSVESRYSQMSQLCRMIRQHLERREYDSVSYLIDSNEELIRKAVGEEREFFDWIHGLLFAYRDGDNEKALDYLIEMEKDVKNGELRVEIIDSIGNRYLKKKEYDKAEAYYKKGFNSFAEWMNHEKKAKLLLNYAICLSRQEKYGDCLEKVMQGLELVVEKNTLFLLGDFFYYKGYCLEKLGQHREAVGAYQKAKTIFDIQQNEKYSLITKMARESLEAMHKEEALSFEQDANI